MKLTDVACRNARPGERPQNLLMVMACTFGYRPPVTAPGASSTTSKAGRSSYPSAGIPKSVSSWRANGASRHGARWKWEATRARSARPNVPLGRLPSKPLPGSGSRHRRARSAPRPFQNKLDRFEAFVFPYLGKRPITEVKAIDVLDALKRVEARGKHETAHRVRSECGNVFRNAVVTGRAERDPIVDLRGAIAAVSRLNRPAIVDPLRIGELMRAIAGYHGDVSTEFALKLLPLTFVRPGELRLAEWSEFNLKAARRLAVRPMQAKRGSASCIWQC
jgi:hypothetical protein